MDNDYEGGSYYYTLHCVSPPASPILPSALLTTPPSTSTPPVVTVTQALLNFAALQTLVQDLVQPTITHWDVAHATTTKSVPWTVTITQTTTPEAWAAECRSGGGRVW